MARLRSAAKRAADDSPPTSSLEDVTAAYSNSSSRDSPNKKTRLSPFKSKMPVPTIPSTPSGGISYPSLAGLETPSFASSFDAPSITTPSKRPEATEELYPTLTPRANVTSTPQAQTSTPSNNQSTPKANPVTPQTGIPLPISATTMKTAKKAAKAELAERLGMTTVTSTPSYTVPSSAEFNFETIGLSKDARQMLEEVQAKAMGIKEQMMAQGGLSTPRQQPPDTPSRAGTVKKRFDDLHKKQFDKMDSISDHYAAKRKAATPANPQKGIKRSQSQAKLEDKREAPTPSPVKQQPETGRKAKKARVEPVSSFASKLGKVAGLGGTPLRKSARAAALEDAEDAGSAGETQAEPEEEEEEEGEEEAEPTTIETPRILNRFQGLLAKGPATSARAAVARRVSMGRKSMPALPRPANGIITSNADTPKLPPTDITPTSPSRTGISKLPRAAAATPSRSNTIVPAIAPATIAAAPRFSLAPATISRPSFHTTTGSAATPAGKRQSTMFPKTEPRNRIQVLKDEPSVRVGVLSPIKLTETVNLDDPFSSGPHDRPRGATPDDTPARARAGLMKSPVKMTNKLKDSEWGFDAPTALPSFPAAPTHAPSPFPKVPTHELVPGGKAAAAAGGSKTAGGNTTQQPGRMDLKRKGSEDLDKQSTEKEQPPSPAKKRARFGSTEPTAKTSTIGKTSGLGKVPTLNKSRLDFLAAPKRRGESAEPAGKSVTAKAGNTQKAPEKKPAAKPSAARAAAVKNAAARKTGATGKKPVWK
ncbi:hypothetical protein BZA77DRAFT_94363 [Pyronema omphalodes]|nr:hypothetical protein BZA77DRAFT_94363 [Pyronema omphalodes]